jgi:DNA-binding GntR family transcriptional regulator
VANQILEFIRNENLEVGASLPEVPLAYRLGVSRSPVRAALAGLAEDGIVGSAPKQGFVLLMDWKALASWTIPLPPSADEGLHMALVQDRIAGLLPDHVTQVALLNRYKVDRDVLTRVMQRLINEGIVIKNRGQGWTFWPVIETASAVRGSYDFRKVIEPGGLLLPSFILDRDRLVRLRDSHLELLERSDTVHGAILVTIDAEFHETLALLTDNKFLHQAVHYQNRLRRMLEYRSSNHRRRNHEWLLEHIAILDALLVDNRALAANRLLDHLQNAHRCAERLV